MNYSRWISVHVENMKTLPLAVLTIVIQGDWVVPKTSRRLTVDQAHEKVSAAVKETSSVSLKTQQHLKDSSPELARLLGEYDTQHNYQLTRCTRMKL